MPGPATAQFMSGRVRAIKGDVGFATIAGAVMSLALIDRTPQIPAQTSVGPSDCGGHG